MREPNEGISRVCIWCGKSFWCTDGDWFCSSKCSDDHEEKDKINRDDEMYENERR